jgi:hypothetical protein
MPNMLQKQKQKRSHKRHQGSITAKDEYPDSVTLIHHDVVANVPGYTWQYNGQPTLKKFKNFMLFVDHKMKLVYPSFQEMKTGAEACRLKREYKTFAKRYNIDIYKYHTDNGAFRKAIFQKEIEVKRQNISFSGVNA